MVVPVSPPVFVMFVLADGGGGYVGLCLPSSSSSAPVIAVVPSFRLTARAQQEGALPSCCATRLHRVYISSFFLAGTATNSATGSSLPLSCRGH